MNFKESTELFIESLSESTKIIYQSKILGFYQFLKDFKGINDESFRSYLEVMRIDEILESLDYYILHNEIYSESIAYHYTSVIKGYFNFIYLNGIKNENIIKSFGLNNTNIESFQYITIKYISDNDKLISKSSKIELNKEEFDIVVAECDQRIDSIFKEDEIFNSKKYNYMNASLIIKLALFTGIAYRTIRTILKNDYNSVNNTLRINGFTFHLPDKLSYQFNEYTKVRDIINPSSQYFFVRKDENMLPKQTNNVTDYLKIFINRGEFNSIVKFAVIEMIKKDINQSIIQDFTGIGSDVFKYCQEEVNSQKNKSASRYLDSKLRSIKTFDLL